MTQQLTKKEDLQSAVYGLSRLVAGFKDWSEVSSVPNEDKLQVLFKQTAEEINNGAELAEHTSLLRKLRAYSQLLQLQRFCFKEIDWEGD